MALENTNLEKQNTIKFLAKTTEVKSNGFSNLIFFLSTENFVGWPLCWAPTIVAYQ